MLQSHRVNMGNAEEQPEQCLRFGGSAGFKDAPVFLKDVRTFHCRTKLEVRKLFSQGLAQDK